MSSSGSAPDVGGESRGRRLEVVTVYGIGLFQGLSLVAFPAAATVLTSPTGYDLTKSRYGLLFLPQVAMAITGSLSLPALARRFPLKGVLIAGVVADTVSMALLVGSDPVRADPVAYPLLLVATGFLGLGFGLTLSSISTYAGAFMPDRRDVALTSLNVLLGLGTALSPLLISIFLHHGQWWYLPLLSAAGLVVLLGLVVLQPMVVPRSGPSRPAGRIPTLFWLFASVLVVYGIGETMFGNWGTTLLTGKGIGSSAATDALAAFWAAATIGRLLISLSASRIRPVRVYLVLPWAMAVALAVAPLAHSAAAGMLLFALGGLACSGYFPMTVGYGEATFPGLVELAAGWLIASYQVGYGLAAFGAGAVQSAISLPSVFRIAAVLCAAMAFASMPIARRQTRTPTAAPAAAGT
jgi:FHS family glucose/mannose:H+ symporter-like MFS transporter